MLDNNRDFPVPRRRSPSAAICRESENNYDCYFFAPLLVTAAAEAEAAASVKTSDTAEMRKKENLLISRRRAEKEGYSCRCFMLISFLFNYFLSPAPYSFASL
jgi:hypothetical protein